MFTLDPTTISNISAMFLVSIPLVFLSYIDHKSFLVYKYTKRMCTYDRLQVLAQGEHKIECEYFLSSCTLTSRIFTTP